MKDLKQLIEELLMTNDCVIVPGLGAFVVSNVKSEYIENEELFLPPYRKVLFNADIQVDNDRLLANHVSNLQAIDLPLAEIAIAREVLAIRQEVLENGNSDFGSIGTMIQDEDLNLVFQPCQAGVNTPSLFGLYSFQMSRIKEFTTQGNSAAKKDANHYIISLNRAAVHYTMAAAAAIVLFFMFITPAENTQTLVDQSRSELFIPFNLTEAHQTSTPVIVSSINKYEANTVEVESVEDTEKENEIAKEVILDDDIQPTKIADTQSTSKYAIVVASAISKTNAENLTESLKAKGYSKASVLTKGSMTRVILGVYATEAEAYEFANNCREKDNSFQGLWVMKLTD